MRPVPCARPLLLAAASAALLLPAPQAATAASPCKHADREVSRSTIKPARGTVRCLLNRIRSERGLERLRGNTRLRRAATAHSRHMIEHNYFSHVTPGGRTLTTRVLASGYLRAGMRYTVGENLGWGENHLGTPREMVRAWMDSPGHRANILHRRWRHVGIGIVLGTPRGSDGATYTTNFGVRG